MGCGQISNRLALAFPGGRFTLCHGAIASPSVNALIERAAGMRGIPTQHDARGRDTGTDAMAAVLAGADCAATSVGFPVRTVEQRVAATVAPRNH